MDAFDSALAITKANGSYSEIFAAQLSSGACRPPSLLCTAQPPNHLPLRVHRTVFIPLDCAADPNLFPFPARIPHTLLDRVLRGAIRTFDVADVRSPCFRS